MNNFYYELLVNFDYNLFVCFSWIFNLFKIGRKRNLEFNDLYVPLNNDESSLLGIELQKYIY